MICLLLLAPASAKANKEAEEQFQTCGKLYLGSGVVRNPAEAARWCFAAANNGHVEAMYNLGLMYYKGDGVAQNYDSAIEWFKRASEEGHRDAEFNLFQLYNARRAAMQQGRNFVPQQFRQVPQQRVVQQQIRQPQPQQVFPTQTPPQPQRNYTYFEMQQYRNQKNCLMAAQRGIIADNCDAQAQQELQQVREEVQNDLDVASLITVAEGGDLLAQNNLGVMYRRGIGGVEQNPAKAYQMFRKSAAQGSTNAMLNLAAMYKHGEGTEQDLEQAYAWYNLASDRLADGQQRKQAQENVKEIAAYLNNEQIGSALQFVTELDDSIPYENE